MKTKSVTILVVAVALAVGVVIVTMAQGASVDGDSAAGVFSPDETTWRIDLVDGSSSQNRGKYVSVAIDPSDGTTHVSYYDATNGDLRWARTVPSGGNCGPNNTWQCETVDSTGDVGQYNSIAVYSSTGSIAWRKVGIAYHDATGGDLKYASYTLGGGGSWATSTIDAGNPALLNGQHTSLAFDSTGKAHISYHLNASLGDDSFKYAQYLGRGVTTGNCGPSNSWQCDTIETGSDDGLYTSIALDALDYPHIVYHNGETGLRYARYNPGYIAGCSEGLAGWWCIDIDSGVAGPVSADADPATDKMHIAYVSTGNKLEYAVPVPSGGNCGPSNTWYCEEIDDVGTSQDTRGVSLAIDDAGHPVIAYQAVSLAPESLESVKVARPGDALGWTPVVDPLNCGGQFTLFATWYCETVDAARFNEANGDYVSTAVDPGGLVTVAYYDQRVLPNPTGYLEVARQWLPIYLPLVLRDQ